MKVFALTLPPSVASYFQKYADLLDQAFAEVGRYSPLSVRPFHSYSLLHSRLIFFLTPFLIAGVQAGLRKVAAKRRFEFPDSADENDRRAALTGIVLMYGSVANLLIILLMFLISDPSFDSSIIDTYYLAILLVCVIWLMRYLWSLTFSSQWGRLRRETDRFQSDDYMQKDFAKFWGRKAAGSFWRLFLRTGNLTHAECVAATGSRRHINRLPAVCLAMIEGETTRIVRLLWEIGWRTPQERMHQLAFKVCGVLLEGSDQAVPLREDDEHVRPLLRSSDRKFQAQLIQMLFAEAPAYATEVAIRLRQDSSFPLRLQLLAFLVQRGQPELIPYFVDQLRDLRLPPGHGGRRVTAEDPTDFSIGEHSSLSDEEKIQYLTAWKDGFAHPETRSEYETFLLRYVANTFGRPVIEEIGNRLLKGTDQLACLRFLEVLRFPDDRLVVETVLPMSNYSKWAEARAALRLLVFHRHTTNDAKLKAFMAVAVRDYAAALKIEPHGVSAMQREVRYLANQGVPCSEPAALLLAACPDDAAARSIVNAWVSRTPGKSEFNAMARFVREHGQLIRRKDLLRLSRTEDYSRDYEDWYRNECDFWMSQTLTDFKSAGELRQAAKQELARRKRVKDSAES